MLHEHAQPSPILHLPLEFDVTDPEMKIIRGGSLMAFAVCGILQLEEECRTGEGRGMRAVATSTGTQRRGRSVELRIHGAFAASPKDAGASGGSWNLRRYHTCSSHRRSPHPAGRARLATSGSASCPSVLLQEGPRLTVHPVLPVESAGMDGER